MPYERFIRCFLLSVITILPIPLLHSQTPSFHHYTISDGLASSTVFDIIQDTQGFLLIATLNGLSRFDGTHFKTFTVRDGLNSNTITSLLERHDGAVYVATYQKGINILRNDRVENYRSVIDGKDFATSYLLEDRERLYAYGRGGPLNVISNDPSTEHADYSASVRPAHINRLETLSDGTVLALTEAGLYTLNVDSLAPLRVKGLPRGALFCLSSRTDGSFVVGAKGKIWHVRNDSVVGSFPVRLFDDGNDVVAILSDTHENIWFSITNRGFFLVLNGTREILDVGRKLNLQNTLVNRLFEDREGNIWAGTFGDGVYCLNNLSLGNYTDRNGMSSNNVYSIANDGAGRLLVGTFNGINVLNRGVFTRIETGLRRTPTEYIYSIKADGNNIFVCGGFSTPDVVNLTYEGLNLHLFPHSTFCKTSNGLSLFGTWINTFWVQEELRISVGRSPPFFVFGDSSQANRINEIIEDSEKNIWVATTLGVCRISGLPGGREVWKKTYFPDDPVLSEKILAIRQVNERHIWFAGERGIARYDLEQDTLTSFTTLLGHDVSTATSIVSDEKQRMWIGTMHGLYRFDGTSMLLLNRRTGLCSDEVFSLSYDPGDTVLYVGTSGGLSVLDVNLFGASSPSSLSVTINSIRAGDSVYTRFDNLTFEPEQNNVSISFAAPSFASPGSVRYAYRLYDTWVETDHGLLNLIPLRGGSYEIQIKARAQNTDWSRPTSLLFSVKPRMIETLWFSMGILAAVVVLIFAVTAWSMKRKAEKVRKQLELSERINELKHQALSAIMNPHFIFNSLNSVQYLIHSRRNEEANEYIAMMAQLIRKNLDTAGDGFILLSEEIERLTLYLDLEKLRLQDRFSYEIVTGADLDAGSVMIPNMIVQPFVENTLWHGIIDSGRPGLISISFSFEDVEIDSMPCTSLIIKVTDNGVGVLEAKKRKKEDHTSKGIHIIEERLRLLSTKFQLPQPIEIEDLGTRDGDSHGTEVIISLPPPLYTIISPGSGPSSSASHPEE